MATTENEPVALLWRRSTAVNTDSSSNVPWPDKVSGIARWISAASNLSSASESDSVLIRRLSTSNKSVMSSSEFVRFPLCAKLIPKGEFV